MNFTHLIQTEELAQNIGKYVVVDVRHELTDPPAGERAYGIAHIPGAYFLHGDRDLAAPLTGTNGRHPLPEAESFVATLRHCGIGPESQVVAYDAQGGSWAARFWWMLRWVGHARVAVLDGGWPKWTQEGRPTTADVPAPGGGTIALTPSAETVDAEFILRQIGSPGFCLIDARAADRFRGENETIDPVAGHIPGARNRCFKDNLDPSGCFKPAATLREEFLSVLDGTPAAQVIHQCGSGVTACHNLFAMELAGLSGARLYPGSWSEWIADPRRPIERG